MGKKKRRGNQELQGIFEQDWGLPSFCLYHTYYHITLCHIVSYHIIDHLRGGILHVYERNTKEILNRREKQLWADDIEDYAKVIFRIRPCAPTASLESRLVSSYGSVLSLSPTPSIIPEAVTMQCCGIHLSLFMLGYLHPTTILCPLRIVAITCFLCFSSWSVGLLEWTCWKESPLLSLWLEVFALLRC